MFSGSETVIILAHSDPRKRVHSLEKPPSLADQGCWNPCKAQVCLQGQVAHGQNFSLVGEPQPEVLIIGLAKEFVQGFPYTLFFFLFYFILFYLFIFFFVVNFVIH